MASGSVCCLKKDNKNYKIVVFIPNHEIYFYRRNGVLEVDVIAFGSWWDLSTEDAEKLFMLLNLGQYINDIFSNCKIVHKEFDSKNVNWKEVSQLI